MRSLQVWAGFPLVFFTLNPADVKHPFTLHLSVDGLRWQKLSFACNDDALLEALGSIILSRLVAADPVAAVKAVDLHVRSFFAHLLGCTIDPARLAKDGIASDGVGGLVGDIFAAFGAVEPQMRGSLHIHMLLHILGFFSPQMRVARCHYNFEALRQGLWR